MEIINRKKGSFIVTPISFNKKKLNALVDTGSPITILDESFRNTAKPATTATIHGINGRTKVKKYMDYVVITNERKEVLTTVYFMDLSHLTDNYGKGLNIQAIFGMDLFTKTKITQCLK